MAIPKEPRQAMINMMYLVLTALLALNVSKEVLNAFQTVNNGMELTNAALTKSMNEYIEVFKKRADRDSSAIPLYQKAIAAQTAASGLFDEIEEMKKGLLEMAGYEVDEFGKKVPLSPSDTHGPTLYMVNEGRADKLEKMILAAKEQFINFFDKDKRETVEITLDAKVREKAKKDGKNWAQDNFEEVPVVAALTIMSKIQNDVLTSQQKVIEDLKSRVGLDNIEFDNLKGRAIAKKSYLTSGETYEADIFVSASSSSVTPKVFIGKIDRSKVTLNETTEELEKYDGTEPPLIGEYQTYEPAPGSDMVRYEVPAGGVGEKQYEGVIEILNAKTGKKQYFPFEAEYLVAASQAVVSPTAMNVIYKGIPNPIEISVPGAASKDIQASIGVGKLTSKGSGTYEVLVPGNSKQKKTNINVSVKMASGGTKTAAAKEFRLKSIPNPQVLWGSNPNVIKLGQAKAINGIVATADNFPLEVRFQIREFTMMHKSGRSSNLFIEENKGNIFNQKITSRCRSQLRVGDKVYFDDVKVKAPDGSTRTISVSYKIL